MDHFQYLIVMALCVLVTLPLELFLGAKVYRRWKLLLLAMLPMLIVFVVWDIVGIIRGHWWYSDQFITGVNLGPMPLEELVFFIVVPLCGVLTYEAVGTVLRRLRGLRGGGTDDS